MRRFLGLRSRFGTGLPYKTYSPNTSALAIAPKALTRRLLRQQTHSKPDCFTTFTPSHTTAPTPSPTKS